MWVLLAGTASATPRALFKHTSAGNSVWACSSNQKPWGNPNPEHQTAAQCTVLTNCTHAGSHSVVHSMPQLPPQPCQCLQAPIAIYIQMYRSEFCCCFCINASQRLSCKLKGRGKRCNRKACCCNREEASTSFTCRFHIGAASLPFRMCSFVHSKFRSESFRFTKHESCQTVCMIPFSKPAIHFCKPLNRTSKKTMQFPSREKKRETPSLGNALNGPKASTVTVGPQHSGPQPKTQERSSFGFPCRGVTPKP